MANIRKSFNFRTGLQVDNDNFVVNANGLVGIGTSIPQGYLLNVMVCSWLFYCYTFGYLLMDFDWLKLSELTHDFLTFFDIFHVVSILDIFLF